MGIFSRLFGRSAKHEAKKIIQKLERERIPIRNLAEAIVNTSCSCAEAITLQRHLIMVPVDTLLLPVPFGAKGTHGSFSAEPRRPTAARHASCKFLSLQRHLYYGPLGHALACRAFLCERCAR